jgi:GAF domain-containing protein
MRKKRAIVLENATTDENALAAERYAAVGGVTSAVISPVQQAGRFLGVIELLNPLDGIGFKNEEGNAIDYISEQFGDFVATKGMQLDADRISRSVPPSQLT